MISPQVACGFITDGSLQSTATPLDAFKNAVADGTIVKYDTLDAGTLYGLVHGDGSAPKTAPTATTPLPSANDVHA